MERFIQLRSLAGILQPGDATRYKMVAVKTWDTVEVIVMNDDFFDKITFLSASDGRIEPYSTFRGEQTNPWTIKAAKEMRDMLMGGI